ncbi:MAG: cache domain-containing protein [Anaerolineae bacterium]|nr:cache domain-containing protein [Anaerolineae bacterium]
MTATGAGRRTGREGLIAYGNARQFLFIAALLLLLTLLAAPVAAQTPCDSHAGRLADLHSREQLKRFVQCTAAHVATVGWEQAAQDFETSDWRDGPVYIFAGTAAGKIILVAGADVEPGTDALDRVDADGAHVSHQHLRVSRDFGAGYVYYRFNNPVTGETEPKVTWITPVEHEGEAAYIGAGYYPTDTHATCLPDLARASLVYTERDVERFVTCAEHHLRQHGLQAIHDFNTDPRWNAGRTYLFLFDLQSLRMLANPGQPHLVGTIRNAAAYAAGRVQGAPETQRILGSHDDGYVYYTFRNPATEEEGRKIAYFRRFLLEGRFYHIGSGLYVPADECRDLPLARDLDTRDQLQQFVRCAAQLVEERGAPAFDRFLNHPQWIGGATYLFVLDQNCRYLATPNPVGAQTGACDFEDAEGTPVDQEIRARVTSEDGEGWLRYVLQNPLSGEVEGKESYVVGVMLNGELISVAAGLYESQMQS